MNSLLKRKAFNFYASYDEAFEVLSEKKQIKLFKAIRDVEFFRADVNTISFDDAELKFAWLVIKHSIENQVLGYCRANKIKYDELSFDTPKDTPRVSPKDTPRQVQVQVQVQEEEEEEEEEEYTLACRTIDYLNQVAGKKFGYGAGNLKEIKAQIKKGATEEQFAHIINVKCAEWLNSPEMKKNLNPVTLFREANFDRYLNQELVLSDAQKIDAYYRAKEEGVL